jgi:hypothetical protein
VALPLQPQFHPSEAVGHVTPPFRITESPGFGLMDAQVLAQPYIPGACCNGVVLDVPLFVSTPLE